MLDSEHVRRAIGEVATAYGICLEPHNVAAGGQSCPLRFRCVGCDHFRTDVSYLPDLERYLSDLLRSRQRLMLTFEADDWARSEAIPSEEEIRRVRRLINRVKADLDDLSEEERAQIEEAVAVVRRSRTVIRLSLAPGAQAWQESGLGAPADVDELQRKITRLEQHNAELTSALEEARSDLDAAREANRDLARALNQRG